MNESIERYEGTLSVTDLRQQVQLIQNIMQEVMIAGEHFGTIPGCGDKKILFKSGAEVLSMTFRMAPTYKVEKTDLPNGHREYQITCSLSHIYTKNFLGEGLGVATTMESKHRFRKAAKKCPTCHKEAIIKGKEEYGGGWLCYKAKGGCGEKWNDGAKVIEDQPTGNVEHDNPADFYNTVIKMGKKRAQVDAVLTATAASDIFTQDLEEETPIKKDSAPEPEQKKAELNKDIPPAGREASNDRYEVSPISHDKFVTSGQATAYRKECFRLKIPTKKMKDELKKHGITMPDNIPADQFDARFKELEFVSNDEKQEVSV